MSRILSFVPRAALTVVILDIVALIVPAYKADLYLRPLAMILLAATAFLSGEKRSAIFLRIGLVLALIVETLQRVMEIQMEFIAVGTAAYYVFYTIYFAVDGGFQKSVRSVLPFVAVSAYAVILFIVLEPYGLLRMAAMIYIPVAVAMTGLGTQSLAHRRTGAHWIAYGALLLLFSDSIRAWAVFKGSWMRDEALILLFYFAGQLALVRSLQKTPAASTEGS